MNKRFHIKTIGEVEYIATLLCVDYPITFVVRKVDSECELYIFDEIDNDDNSIKWICSRISIDELDGLNKGTKTLNSCFYGPRRSRKPGYLITSISGHDIAECQLIEDVSQYVDKEEIYAPQFIKDDHGSSVLALATNKVLLSLVLNDEKYANPFFDISNLSDTASSGRTFLNSLPYNIVVKNNRACVQSNQSVVINFEISDKPLPNNNPKQLKMEELENSINNSESKAALDSVKRAFESGGDQEKLINAFNSDKKVLQKFNKFIHTLKKNNNNGRSVQFVDSQDNSQSDGISLTNEVLDITTSNVVESIKVLERQKKHTDTIDCFGYFEMFDNKGKRRFRFIGEDGIVYRGITSNSFDISKCPIVMQDANRRYLIKMKCSYFVINGKQTKSPYELLFAKEEKRPKQEIMDF